MNQKKYRTGELVEFLGFTRDILLYYETKGIITPYKNPENNYREYSHSDIYTMLAAEYYKKRGLSIQEIQDLQQSNSPLEIVATLQSKRDTLQSQLEKLAQTISQLDESIDFAHTIPEHLDTYSLQPFPIFEVKEEIISPRDFTEFSQIASSNLLNQTDLLTNILRKVSFDEKDNTLNHILYGTRHVTKPLEYTYNLLPYKRCLYRVFIQSEKLEPYAAGLEKEDVIITNLIQSALEHAAILSVTLESHFYINTRFIAYKDTIEHVYFDILFPIQE